MHRDSARHTVGPAVHCLGSILDLHGTSWWSAPDILLPPLGILPPLPPLDILPPFPQRHPAPAPRIINWFACCAVVVLGIRRVNKPGNHAKGFAPIGKISRT